MPDNIPSPDHEHVIDLQDFVRDALIQVGQGVEDAQRALAESSAIVNPRRLHISGFESDQYYASMPQDPDDNRPARLVQAIKFDVAVQAAETKGLKAGGGIKLSVVKAEAGASRDRTTGSESRIGFTVPMVLPDQEGQTCSDRAPATKS